MATVTSPRRAAPARTRTPTRRSAPSRPPRRLSGPGRGRGAAAAAPRQSLPLGGRALALVRGLPDHSLIDRLVRGRAWIPVLGVLLAGIVAMQVEILKLGSSMGRAVEQTASLQVKNEALQTNVATLADDQRIERIAAAKGMVMPSAGSLVFLSAQPNGGLGRALGNIHAPDPSTFMSELAAQAAAAAALTPSAPATTGVGTAGVTAAPTGGASTVTSTSPAPSPVAPASTTPTVASNTSAAAVAPTTGPATTSGAAPTVSAPAGAATGAAGIAPATSSQTSGG